MPSPSTLSMPTRIFAGTGGGVYEYLTVEPCVPDATTLCLSGGRFKIVDALDHERRPER